MNELNKGRASKKPFANMRLGPLATSHPLTTWIKMKKMEYVAWADTCIDNQLQWVKCMICVDTQTAPLSVLLEEKHRLHFLTDKQFVSVSWPWNAARSDCTCPSQRLPWPYSWPRTPFQLPRAISPCLSDAVHRSVSRCPQPCPTFRQGWGCPAPIWGGGISPGCQALPWWTLGEPPGHWPHSAQLRLLITYRQSRATFTECETTQEPLLHSMRALSSAGSFGVSITSCSLIRSLKSGGNIFSSLKSYHI